MVLHYDLPLGILLFRKSPMPVTQGMSYTENLGGPPWQQLITMRYN